MVWIMPKMKFLGIMSRGHAYSDCELKLEMDYSIIYYNKNKEFRSSHQTKRKTSLK